MCVHCRLGVIPTFLLALTVTLVLVFFPRSSETPPPFQEIEVSSPPRYPLQNNFTHLYFPYCVCNTKHKQVWFTKMHFCQRTLRIFHTRGLGTGPNTFDPKVQFIWLVWTLICSVTVPCSDTATNKLFDAQISPRYFYTNKLICLPFLMCLETAVYYNLMNSDLIKKKKKLCRRDSQEGRLSIYCWFSVNSEEFKSCMLELIYDWLCNINVRDVFI